MGEKTVEETGTGLTATRPRCWIGTPILLWLVLMGPFLELTLPAADQPPRTDAEITRRIESELSRQLPVATNIVVATTNGVVIFSGSVDSLLARERAMDAVAAIAGVRRVIDRLKVTPPERADAELQEDVNSALASDAGAASLGIKAGVTNGVVVLTGDVNSWAAKQLAAVVARNVTGVKAVMNNIQIHYAAAASDEELHAAIQTRLENDAWVDARGITTLVTNGTVKLQGQVASLYEKTRAIHDAWIQGVKAIDHSALKVNASARLRRPRETPAPATNAPADSAIARAAAAVIGSDPMVGSDQVAVTVSNGVVTLSGFVPSLPAKSAAELDARSVRGVRDLQSYLKILPPSSLSDAQLEQRVQAALRRHPYLGALPLEAAVANGQVSLNGAIQYPWQNAEALRVASSVAGVKQVQSNLQLANNQPLPPAGYAEREAFTGPWPYSDYDIRGNVKDHIFYDPYVSGFGIHVSVQNGVVRLTGAVDTWADRRAAGNDAYKGGARQVVNELKVRQQ